MIDLIAIDNICQDMKPDRTSTKTSDHLANRQIRVFISSTFRDMQTERELLVKKVFPELRRICEEAVCLVHRGADEREG